MLVGFLVSIPNDIAADGNADSVQDDIVTYLDSRHPELIVSCQTLPAVARLTKAREPDAPAFPGGGRCRFVSRREEPGRRRAMKPGRR